MNADYHYANGSAVQSPLSDSVGVQLASYRPARDIDGNSLPYADWDRWYRSVDSRVLSQMFNNRMDPRASQAAIFATIQWMYYALWRKRITFAQMVSLGSSLTVPAYCLTDWTPCIRAAHALRLEEVHPRQGAS